MRKFIFGETAMLTVLLALAPVAAKAEMDVTVGGYSTFYAGMFNNTYSNQTHRDFEQEAEIHIKANGEADNGLKYGAKVELYASTSDTTNADEVGLFFSGDWGRLELGDEDGASDQLSVVAPTVGIGQINGRYLDFVRSDSRPAGNVKDTGGGMIKSLDTDDATKITYYTPRYQGFQAGVSYAPEADDQSDGEEVQFSKLSGNQQNFIESGINYRGRFQGVRVGAGLTYDHADAKPTSGREDVNAFGLGARLGYKKFELGGGYVDNGDSNNLAGTASDDETAWNVGLAYRDDVWSVAVSDLYEDYQSAGGRGIDTSGGTYNAVVLGGNYKIADGLSAGADLAFFRRDKDTGTDDHGYVLVVATRASF